VNKRLYIKVQIIKTGVKKTTNEAKEVEMHLNFWTKPRGLHLNKHKPQTTWKLSSPFRLQKPPSFYGE
jgi:hypothetical protein